MKIKWKSKKTLNLLSVSKLHTGSVALWHWDLVILIGKQLYSCRFFSPFSLHERQQTLQECRPTMSLFLRTLYPACSSHKQRHRYHFSHVGVFLGVEYLRHSVCAHSFFHMFTFTCLFTSGFSEINWSKRADKSARGFVCASERACEPACERFVPSRRRSVKPLNGV